MSENNTTMKPWMKPWCTYTHPNPKVEEYINNILGDPVYAEKLYNHVIEEIKRKNREIINSGGNKKKT